MKARYVLILAIVVAVYVLVWSWLTPLGRAQFERFSVAACMVIASVMYLFITVSYKWARKTRLNTAFAAKHMLWGLFIILFALPNAIGVIVNHAPYAMNTPRNHYALFDIPASIRTALWIGIAISAVMVIHEFYEANWDGPIWRNVRRGKTA